MSVRHDLSYIAETLVTSQMADCGISPSAEAQNQHIFGVLRELGPELHERYGLIGLQPVGSRVHGTNGISGDGSRSSDTDLIVVGPSGDHLLAIHKTLSNTVPSEIDCNVMKLLGIAGRAVMTLRDIEAQPPVEANDFIDTMVFNPELMVSLFHDGVFASDALRLNRLAATTVFFSESQAVQEEMLATLRERFNWLYLGDHAHMLERSWLVRDDDGRLLRGNALADTAERVGNVITQQVMATRIARFGLGDLTQHHIQMLDWFAAHKHDQSVTSSPSLELYQEVASRVGATES